MYLFWYLQERNWTNVLVYSGYFRSDACVDTHNLQNIHVKCISHLKALHFWQIVCPKASAYFRFVWNSPYRQYTPCPSIYDNQETTICPNVLPLQKLNASEWKHNQFTCPCMMDGHFLCPPSLPSAPRDIYFNICPGEGIWMDDTFLPVGRDTCTPKILLMHNSGNRS